MNKMALIYMSVHHNNTEKLIGSAEGVDVYRADEMKDVDLSGYDIVGIASGVYMGRLHQSIVDCVKAHRKELKDVFVVYTSGSGNPKYGERYRKELEAQGLKVPGVYSCRGFDTFGPWKLIGGIAKKHPNQKDIDRFRTFLNSLHGKV